MTRLKIVWMMLFACLGWAGLAAQVKVDAYFEPPVVSLGQTARYVVTFEGARGSPRGDVPKADVLEIVGGPAVSNQTQIINGQVSQSVSYTFSVRSYKTGTHRMPAWQVEIDGNTFTVPQASLQVTERSKELDEAMFLHLELPDGPYYLGQAIPARFQVFLRADLHLSDIGNLQIEGDAFSLSDLAGQPIRQQEQRNGMRYQVLNWPILVTPLKAGKETLRYDLDITFIKPDGSSHPRLPSMFNDPFFGGLRGNAQQARLTTGDLKLEVLSLPGAGQPDYYSGGVGLMSMTVNASPESVTVGEPVTVKAVITGEGNFERLGAPVVDGGEAWNVYPPKSDFLPKDQLGYEGAKTYEFLVVPRAADLKALPPVQFSFFDPETATYVDLSSKPLPIQVAPAPAGSAPVAAAPQRTPAAPTVGQAAPGDRPLQDMLPLAESPGRWVSSLRPTFLQPGFLLVNGGLGVAFAAAGAVFYLRRRRAANPDILRRRNLQATIQQAQAALRRAPDLTALQEAHGRHLQAYADRMQGRIDSAHIATWQEIETALRSSGLTEQEVAACKADYAAWQAAKYGRAASSSADLIQQRERLLGVWKALGASR